MTRTVTPTTAELDAFRARARRWLQRAAIPEQPTDYEERFQVARSWHRKLFEAGWVGLQWPEEHGGKGLTIQHQLVFTEELVRTGAPQPVGSIGLEVVGPTILRYGTPAQRARFIRPLLSAAELWCQGFSEPEAGSDLGSLRTRGKVDGEEIVISGQKIWTSWATHADWCAVLVRTDPEAPKHRGISYILTDMRSPGLTVRPIVQLTGDAEFGELFFDEVRVPLTNVLGPLHGGWQLTMDTLGHERAAYAIRRRLEIEASFNQLLAELRSSIGAGQTCLDDHLAERIGHAQVRMRAFAALSRRTAERLVAGDVPSAMDSVDKLVLANTEQELFGSALDLLGAHRMSGSAHPNGLDAERIIKAYLYGRAASVYGGSTQIQRSLIAERLLGLPRSSR